MKKKLLALAMVFAMVFALAACGGGSGEIEEAAPAEKTAVNVFAAASLGSVMAEFEAAYEEENPDVDIVINADSSGALLTQIQEGAPCDIFFSAAQKQMDELEGAGMVVDGTRTNVVNNQLVVVTQPDSKTEVTGLADIGKAKSIALADGSVPVCFARTGYLSSNSFAASTDNTSARRKTISSETAHSAVSIRLICVLLMSTSSASFS